MFVFIPVIPHFGGIYSCSSPWCFITDIIMLIVFMSLLCSFMKK